MSERAESPRKDSDSLHLVSKRHEKFMIRVLQTLPDAMKTMETHRLTIAFFAVSSLDILGALDKLTDPTREEIIEWIYSLQTTCSDVKNFAGGFRGSDYLTFDGHEKLFCSGHVAATYCGLSALVILGDDLSRVNKEAVCANLASLQLPDGSLRASSDDYDSDMRQVYSAVAVSYILNNWSGLNKELTIKRQTSKLTKWCIFRLKEGFNGRPNKLDDTCYSFWVGATLSILSKKQDWAASQISKSVQFVLSTQDPIIGGMGKWPDSHPDPVHTHMGLSGLSLSNSLELSPVYPALNISERAFKHLRTLHETSHKQEA